MIYFDAGGFDWSHFFETFFGGLGACATAATVVYTVYARNKDKRDKLESDNRQALLEAAKKVEQKTEQRHEENQRILARITTLLRYFRPHRHGERSGTLTVEGIDYEPREDD